MRASAVRSPASSRAMPQYSHSSSPISRWKDSGLRSPSAASSRPSRSPVSRTTEATSGWSAVTGGCFGLRAR